MQQFPLIFVEGLAKSYPGDGVETKALQGVTFSIKKGEFVAIMGPSGSGKSTLLHILGFLDYPTGGAYRFEGKTMSDYSDEEIAHIRNEKMGFVFQAFNLLPRASVMENVTLPLLYSSIPTSQWNTIAQSAIESVGMEHRTEHEPSQLSGGERQRVAIARALVNDPEVIFADEPTGNLDSASGKIVMGTLERLNKEQGHTIILITHETFTAEHAERIITIEDGKVKSDEPVKNRRTSADAFLK